MPDLTATIEMLRAIVASELGLKIDEVTPLSSFVDDLGADSLDSIEIAMKVEEEFEIEISDDEMEKAQTVEQLAHLIEQKKGE